MANAFELIEAQLADPNAQWSLGHVRRHRGVHARRGRAGRDHARSSNRLSVVTPRGGIRLDGAPGPAPGRVRDDHHAGPGASASRSACPEADKRDEPPRRADRAWAGPPSAARAGSRRRAVRSRARRASGRLLHPHRGRRIDRRPARRSRPLAVRAGQSRDGADPPAQPASRVRDARRAAPRSINRYRSPAARRRTGRTPMCCRSCWRTSARMRRPSRSRAASFPARISIRRIRCATATAARCRSTAGRYAAFQRLLSRFGDIEHVRLKRNVVKALNAGAGPEAIAMPADRFAQASIRDRAAPGQGERRAVGRA